MVLQTKPIRINGAACPFQEFPMLHGWDNFFIMAETAGATLIGLLFVAVTLSSGLSTARSV